MQKINANQDAHGQVILSYFKKQHSFDVVERNDGYINIDAGADMYFSEYPNWRNHEKEAIKHAKGRCLDIGCGAGRVLLYLQRKGFKPTGIDSSPIAVKVCRLRGAKDARSMDIEDIGKFSKGSFNSIIMFGNNFGLFGSRIKAKRLLNKLRNITSEDAVIIAESRDPYLTDNPIHFKYHQRNRKLGRMPGQLRIRVRFQQYATNWYDYLYASKREMDELLNGSGWEIERFIDAKDYKKNGEFIAIIKRQGK
ncbi:MAG: class I SAM-dependent methyltransferase [Candidatus Micrarchaeaceae archaeon]